MKPYINSARKDNRFPQISLLDDRTAKIDSIVTLRQELHKVLWDRDCSFPILQFLLMLHHSLRNTNTSYLRLPATVAVYVLSFLGNPSDPSGQCSMYIKSDELYARALILGEVLGLAEKRVWLRVVHQGIHAHSHI